MTAEQQTKEQQQHERPRRKARHRANGEVWSAEETQTRCL
jgi:hypothetical protein